MLFRQGDARLVRGVGLVVCALVGAYLSHSFYAFVVPADAAGMYVPGVFVSVVILTAVLVGGFYALYINPRSAAFMIEVEAEGKKTSWPEWVVVKSSTMQVIVVMVFFMVFMFAVDFVLSALRDLVY